MILRVPKLNTGELLKTMMDGRRSSDSRWKIEELGT